MFYENLTQFLNIAYYPASQIQIRSKTMKKEEKKEFYEKVEGKLGKTCI